jgi:excisionase family DNA binding protein
MKKSESIGNGSISNCENPDSSPKYEKPGMLTMNEVSKILKISTTHVRRLIATNALPHYRFGRAFRFEKQELSDWMASQRVVLRIPERRRQVW